MFQKVFFILCTALAVASLPHYVAGILGTDSAPTDVAAVKGSAATVLPASTEVPANYTTGARVVSIAMDASGHFNAGFKVNGRGIKGLIDTGATYVAINEATAKSVGLHLTDADFGYSVSTANGRTRAALVILDRVDLGPISVSNVEAFVLDDTALSSTLIGMSFMSKIESYAVRNKTLELRN